MDATLLTGLRSKCLQTTDSIYAVFHDTGLVLNVIRSRVLKVGVSAKEVISWNIGKMLKRYMHQFLTIARSLSF